MQMRGGRFDVFVFALAGSRHDRERRAAVKVFEIAIGKFIAALGARAFVFIDPEIPFLIFTETVFLDEFIGTAYISERGAALTSSKGQ